MAQNNGSDVPRLPEWVNLDGVIPPELQHRMAELEVRLEAKRDELEALARASYAAALAFNKAINESGAAELLRERLYAAVDHLSGHEKLYDAWVRLANQAGAFIDTGEGVDWKDEERELFERQGLVEIPVFPSMATRDA